MAKQCATCNGEVGWFRAFRTNECDDCQQKRRDAAQVALVAEREEQFRLSQINRRAAKVVLASSWSRPQARLQPQRCANCGGQGPFELKTVTFLRTNVGNDEISLRLCEWCYGDDDVKASRMVDAMGRSTHYAVDGVHPDYAREFVRMNIDNSGQPIWTIITSR